MVLANSSLLEGLRARRILVHDTDDGDDDDDEENADSDLIPCVRS